MQTPEVQTPEVQTPDVQTPDSAPTSRTPQTSSVHAGTRVEPFMDLRSLFQLREEAPVRPILRAEKLLPLDPGHLYSTTLTEFL